MDTEITAKEFPDEEKETESIAETSKDSVFEKLCELEKLFKDRIAYDEHKNQLFDKLYEDKKRYEDDVIASITDPIIMDIIRVIEEVQAQIDKIPEESSQENYDNLVKKYKSIPQRLEDILYEYDIEPYDVIGDDPDVKQQKIVRVVETENAELSGRIAEKLTRGYKKGNRVIKSERITVYKCNKEDE